MITGDNRPPYVRIVDDLRRRVSDGDLAPGDRLPSIRRIATEWDVALATATKALAVLRQEGLVSAQPRIGIVVAAPTPAVQRPALPAAGPVYSHAPVSGHGLTRERIVHVAMEIADAEGLAAVSVRGIAARLGVATMSLYRYVHSKHDLVLLMANAAFGEADYPAQPPPGWRACLELSARTLWVLCRKHPWLPQVGSPTRPFLLPHLISHVEWVLRALDGHDLAPETVLKIQMHIYCFVQGVAANLEREVQAEITTGLSGDQWMNAHAPTVAALIASGRYPMFSKVSGTLQAGTVISLDDLFEFGLTPMLDGLAVLIEQKPA